MMSYKHRCGPEIRLQILDFCREEPRSKSDLTYLLGTNYSTVVKYVDELVGMGLLECSDADTTRTYASTQKGISAAGMARASGIVCEEAKA
ncbi:MAG: winged helix-turn-helix domain-containing protein [Methanothrix sp.]